MHYFEAEELAARIAGVDPDADDDYTEKAEQWLADKWDISLEQFQWVAEALLPYTVQAKTAITSTLVRGYVHDGAFICKERVED